VTLLGSTGAWPEAGRACSGFLVRSRGFHLVMDLGYGTLANLERHLPPSQVDAVIVTHAHPDHYLDLHPLFRARHFTRPAPPALPLHAPRGVLDRIAQLEEPEDVESFRASFAYRELTPGESLRVGPFHVETKLLPHYVPDAGLRLETDGRSVAYTGDTGPTDDLVRLAEGADLFIAEASNRGDPARFHPRYHLRARDAGEYAARADARQMLLTHFWPGTERSLALSEAGREFEGTVTLADEHLELTL
jgi:ribonuclease BN (tRNA processing enzyme)